MEDEQDEQQRSCTDRDDLQQASLKRRMPVATLITYILAPGFGCRLEKRCPASGDNNFAKIMRIKDSVIFGMRKAWVKGIGYFALS